MALKTNIVKNKDKTDYESLIKKVAPSLRRAYENKTGVYLEETNFNFTLSKKNIRDTRFYRIVMAALMVVMIIITVFLLLTSSNSSPDRVNFIVVMIIVAVTSTIYNHIRDNEQIARMASLQYTDQLALARFRDAVKYLCLDDQDFNNLVFLTPKGVLNNLKEMARRRLHTEGYREFIEHQGKLADPIKLSEAKQEEELAGQAIENAIDCLEFRFHLMFKQKNIFRMVSKEMSKLPSEPLRGFPAELKDKCG